MKILILLLLAQSPSRAQVAPSASGWALMVQSLPQALLQNFYGVDLTEPRNAAALLDLLGPSDFDGGVFDRLEPFERAQVVRDIAGRKAAALAKEKGEESLARYSEIRGLLPARLPESEGVRVGITKLAAGAPFALHEMFDFDWSLPGSRERVREAFLSGKDREFQDALSLVMMNKGFGLGKPLDALCWIYPEHESVIKDFFEPNHAVLEEPAAMAAWASSLKRLKALSPAAYEAARKSSKGKPDVDQFFHPVPGNPRGWKRGPYRLPYPLGKGSWKEGSPDQAASIYRGEGPSQDLIDRHELFDRFIDGNFQVLEMMSSKSPPRAILSGVRSLVRLYRRWKGSPLGDKAASSLRRIESRMKEAAADDLSELVMKLSPEHPSDSLHSLVNWMHQSVLSSFGNMWDKEGGGIVRLGICHMPYTCVGEAPIHETLSRNAPLKSFLDGLRSGFHDLLLFSEDRVWIHASLGMHSAEIFADASDPDEGGALRIRFKESGYPGSVVRMRMIASFLEKLGMSARTRGSDYLDAVWDKDHGLDSERSIVEALPLVVKFLHDTDDMDLLFGAAIHADGPAAAMALASHLGEIYFAEGHWPFVTGRNFEEFSEQISRYDAQAKRSSLAIELNGELKRLGLPGMPADGLFGQRFIDLHFTRPIREALARGELAQDERGVPFRAPYSPVERLASEALSNPDESARTASLLNELDTAGEPIGMAGALLAERAQARLDDGSILTVHALRDPSSGRRAFARASVWKESGEPRDLSSSEVSEVLHLSGYRTHADDWNEIQRGRMLDMLKAPVPGSDKASVSGLGASPGTAFGPLVFDRTKVEKGAILAVPYTTPDDLEAISNSAGVIATGGGSLSHAAITTRELGKPSILLPSARWRNGGLEVGFLRRSRSRTLSNGIQVSGIVSEKTVLGEGGFVFIDGRTGRLSRSAEAVQPRAPEKIRPPAEPRPTLPERGEEFRSMRPSVLLLDQASGDIQDIVGGKAAKLGEMMWAVNGKDAFVPNGIAVTHWAFERFLAENGILEPGRDAILAGSLDPEKGVGKEILKALHASKGSLWAVRSSAVQEDGDDAAFAGAAESYLFVNPGDVLDKVVENWASFWLPRGILYRRRHGMGASGIVPATLIQEMVPAEKSGVIFTRNPVTSADEVVINAVYGLGEGAVSGKADSDSYTTRKSDGEETELAHIARKRRQASSSGMRPVPKDLRGVRALTRGETRKLTAWAVKLERHLGIPLDIEFSIQGGRIAILQARPITTP